MYSFTARHFAAYALLAMPIVTAAAPSDQPVVEVYLPVMRGPGLDLALLRAREIVTKRYVEIGVRIVWLNSSPTGGCDVRPLHGSINVTLGTSDPKLRHTSALAYANPYLTGGACVTLLYDRLQDDVRLNPVSTGFVLGYTLSHEIGHVLQGVARHSETGVMKSRWSPNEIRDMPTRPLHFEDGDRALIRDGLGVIPTLPTLVNESSGGH
jgi:hypothetical protein